MASMIEKYGEKKGKEIYYATANKQNRNPETFKEKQVTESLKKNHLVSEALKPSEFRRLYEINRELALERINGI